MAKHRSKEPESLVARYAADLLHEWHLSELPIHIDALASALGIRRQIASYPFAGRVYVEPSGQLVMDLNADDPAPRRRFTCGHEIIHTLFPGFRRELRYRLDIATGASDLRRGEEEYLCDRGAAELLMPAALLADLYGLPVGLAAIERLARDADVSLEAAGNRLVGLQVRPSVFVVLEVGHKPADGPAIRRGTNVPKRLRVRYANASNLATHVPRFKSADDGSVFVRAIHSGVVEEGREPLPGASRDGHFHIEARAFPRGDGTPELTRVLAVATPHKGSQSAQCVTSSDDG